MNYYPFNSRNKLYRNILGAIASGKHLTLRILLHNDAFVHNAYLCIRKDGEDLVEYEMKPAEHLEDYRFYEYTLTFDPGIYRYYFRYTSFYGNFFISKDDNSNGVVSRELGETFRQTIYSNSFLTPTELCGGIIYQIFPDRFYREKINDQPFCDRVIRYDWGGTPYYRQDEPPHVLGNDYFGGNLNGIIKKLDYIKSLGVTIIYLNPIFEAHSNHRYNTADYFKIDPLLGTNEDFKTLCEKAHENDIKIVLDGVFSHTGDDSLYFDKYGRYGNTGAYSGKDSPYKNWYKFGDTKDDYSSWWGVKSLPETDETDPGYIEFICGENGVLAYWLKLGADGWRLDVADELPDVFIDRLRKTVKSVKPDAIIIGEVWEDATTKVSYGVNRRYLLGDQLDTVMNYPFANGIIDFIKNKNAAALCETVLDICEHYPALSLNLLMNHIGTHDTARILDRLILDNEFEGNREAQANVKLSDVERCMAVKKLKLAAVVQYTLPGLPSLYYGDEAGLEGLYDPFCRGCYPWGNEDTDLLNFYRDLGSVRRDLSPLKSGDFEPYYVNGGVLCFMRKDGTATVLTAVNADDTECKITLPKGFKSVFGNKPDENGRLILKQNEYSILQA